MFKTLPILLISLPVLGLAQDALPQAGAEIFNAKCAGCHQFGKTVVGPDLNLSKSHDDVTLKAALGRMELMVGSLSEEEKANLIGLIRSEAPNSLLNPPAPESERPADLPVNTEYVAEGEKLYYGEYPFVNGGMACISCHTNFKEQSSGNGKLGPSLRGSVEKFGEAGLISAIQSAAFPVMREPYKNHPVTREEAEKLVSFLKVNQVTETESPNDFNFLLAGSAVTGILMAFLFFMYAARLKPVRQNLHHY